MCAVLLDGKCLVLPVVEKCSCKPAFPVAIPLACILGVDANTYRTSPNIEEVRTPAQSPLLGLEILLPSLGLLLLTSCMV